MKLVLKKDWDIPINSPIENYQRGHFVGRKNELDLLVNEILRKTSGSILVSGYRGVGKTSLVYKALWNAKNKESNIFTVLINASQLETQSEIEIESSTNIEKEQIRPRSIIENLIRRLYSVSREKNDLNNDIKEKIQKLYRKTIAKEFKLLETYRRQKESSEEVVKEEKAEIFFSEKDIKNVFFLISWIFACFFQFTDINLPNQFINSLINNDILPLLFVYPIPFLLSIRYKHWRKIEEKKENLSKTEELYEFDDSIGNLEFDLEQIHRELKEKGSKKLVYIIDELDKLEPRQVIEVLKFFKNLFTLSEALFIFVGGEEIFKIGLSVPVSEQDIYRSPAYTYFTSRYFLSRPLWNDLNRFLNEIIEEKDISDEVFEKLKRAMSFGAKNDFFDLKKFIKDRITTFNSNNYPIIEIEKLLDKDIQKSRFHKAVTVLFESSYIAINPSGWEDNEQILRALFDHAEQIYDGHSNAKFDDPEEEEIQCSAVRDFNKFLWDNGAFNLEPGGQKKVNIGGEEISINSYRYTGLIPADLPDALDEPTEFQRKFINEFDNYISYVISLTNIFRKTKGKKPISKENFLKNSEEHTSKIDSWGFNVSVHFKKHYVAYKDFSEKNYSSHTREDVERSFVEIFNNKKLMLQSLPVTISKMMVSIFENVSLEINRLNDNPSLFSGSAISVRNALSPHNPFVVFKPDFSRQILLIRNHVDDIQKIKKHIKDNSKNHRLICFVDMDIKERERGLYFIKTFSPEKFRESLLRSFRYIKRFLHS